MKQTPATGALISSEDYRDGIATSVIEIPRAEGPSPLSLPAAYYSKLSPTVLMQNQIPACVAHSAVDNLKLWWFLKTGQWVDFSPRFLDILAKRYDGQPIDGGTTPRLIFKLMAQFGCATEATLPNDTTLSIASYRNDALLTPTVFAEAAKYRIPGYVAVPLDFVATRRFIYMYGAISSLFVIGDEFWTPSWNDADIDPLRTPAVPVSGHQLTPHGWSPAYNILRNEWSAEWAKEGDASYNPVQWAPFIREQWCIASVPQDVKDFLAALPAPADFHYQWLVDMHAGDTGTLVADIKMLQVAYMLLGFLSPLSPAEFGTFGPKTIAANLAYQISKNIAPTASTVVGPRTRAALNAEFAL